MKRIKLIEKDTTSKEFDTLEHRSEEFAVFSGEWLLLQGDQLLAHSRNYCDINREIQKRGLKDCFVHYVPTSSERNFTLI